MKKTKQKQKEQKNKNGKQRKAVIKGNWPGQWEEASAGHYSISPSVPPVTGHFIPVFFATLPTPSSNFSKYFQKILYSCFLAYMVSIFFVPFMSLNFYFSYSLWAVYHASKNTCFKEEHRLYFEIK